jgi:hypothetical protein
MNVQSGVSDTLAVFLDFFARLAEDRLGAPPMTQARIPCRRVQRPYFLPIISPSPTASASNKLSNT